ncbi:RimJ/RimL family protein N-acetyltransferase [Methylobacterium brachiatum]|uniref:RimJ/RimL family protein N-acetyltransferase n=1 Tax=Methylobacterium brachiatum TaxID=269660 RepID=A0AAJ1TT96_9HYPH|nr:GNAT family N-acetyltransferase [Methylobacterium brachiatum]MCB4801383.1 GNAT family N-acetyltransferase [Methylobacterium brachiatum]MDQ0544414.1 RimJ/RimL family protein N-acetyltransferase [Methylobacterium brachiatum]
MSAAADRRAHWRDLVARRLPEAARPGWPVHLDHCFARILLDNACGGPWRDSVAAPAHANMPADGRADLALLNRRSLAWRGKIWRGKIATAPVPDHFDDGDLLLRRWRPADTAPFAALNADPVVMEFFARLRTEPQSAAEAGSYDRRFVADGFGPWALEWDGRFVGFVGAFRIMRSMPFPGGERIGATIELGWRLARDAWGHGLATRAARLTLADLAGRCGIRTVVAYAASGNRRSQAVMERLGMVRAETFAHPGVPEGPLRSHVLYRLDQAGVSA